jgi:electron transfer flavoprotein beta subunit
MRTVRLWQNGSAYEGRAGPRGARVKIVVLVKEVPDTYGARKLDLQTGIADRSSSEAVLDEIGERAIEVALAYADVHPGTDVTLLTMAPESASASVRKGLAMGAASAKHIVGESLVGADMSLTAEVLSAALQRMSFDLVITGNLSTDGAGGLLPAMIAEHLGVPHATALAAVDIADEAVNGTRVSDAGTMTVTVPLPAVISITEALPDARFPNFKGIMAAKKKPYDFVPVGDLGIDPDDATNGRSIMLAVAERPPRAAGTKIIDEGDAGEKLAEFLTSNRLV